MTNVQIMVEKAIKLKEDGLLTSWETGFVESIENYDKKQLRNLSKKQYDVLRKIASKED